MQFMELCSLSLFDYNQGMMYEHYDLMISTVTKLVGMLIVN